MSITHFCRDLYKNAALVWVSVSMTGQISRQKYSLFAKSKPEHIRNVRYMHLGTKQFLKMEQFHNHRNTRGEITIFNDPCVWACNTEILP